MGIYQGNEVARNSPQKSLPQSSQLVEPLWTDPGLKERDLHLTNKQQQKSASAS